jgi:hypothetical protein
MKYTEIQFMAFAPEKKRWWVFEYEVADDEIPIGELKSDEITNLYRPTGRMAGQFASAKDALASFPNATLSAQAREELKSRN